MMISTRRGLLLVAITALVVPAGAMANSIQKLDIWPLDGPEGMPRITVYSTNGESWNRVDETEPVKFNVRLNAECRFEGRGNKAYEGDLQIAGFDIIGDTDPAHFLIPHSKTASATFRWAGGQGQPTNPLNVCATELTKRLSENQDQTKYHIMAKGFTVDYPGAFEVKYRMYCHATGLGRSDLGSDTTLVNARIHCAASDLAEAKIPPPPKPKPKAARLTNLIKSVSFESEPKTFHGDCPTTVRFNGAITAGRKGTVKYQYVSHDGRTSPTFSLNFKEAGTQTTRAWSRTLSKPDTTGDLAAPGAKSEWDHQGWYRLEVLDPAKPVHRETANYQVSCKPLPVTRFRKVD